MPRDNYYKVQRPGRTAALTVGKFIPKDWKIVKVYSPSEPNRERYVRTNELESEHIVLIIERVA